MKHFILAFALLFISFSAAHAQRSGDVRSIGALNGYSFGFTFLAKDVKGASIYEAKGDIVVSGARFRLEIPHKMVVVSDGVTQWVYNCSNEEILISGSEFSQHIESSSSPSELVEKMAGVFVGANKGYEKVVEKRDKGGNPVEVVLKWEKGSYVIRIVGEVVEKNTPPELFSLDIGKYPEAVVTDLR